MSFLKESIFIHQSSMFIIMIIDRYYRPCLGPDIFFVGCHCVISKYVLATWSKLKILHTCTYGGFHCLPNCFHNGWIFDKFRPVVKADPMSALGNSLVIWRWVLRQMALKVTSSISDSGKSGHRPIDSYKITPFTSLKVQRFMDSSLPRNPAIPSAIFLDILWYALICLYCSRKVKAGQDSGLTKKTSKW